MKGRASGKIIDNENELQLKSEEMGLTGKEKENYIRNNYIFKGIVFDEEYVDRFQKDRSSQNQHLPDQT